MFWWSTRATNMGCSRPRSATRDRPLLPLGNHAMRYRKLGGTGLLVSEICLGTMTFGGGGTWTAIGELDQAGADGIVARALETGVNFIDTADVYAEGRSEEITGRAIANS